MTDSSRVIEGHAGAVAVAVAQAHGVQAMFTLSGAHVFPLYDGAVKAEPPLPIYDVRHEQTAVFAAEAMGKLTRRPGLAVLTAGPGVTNGISAIAQAHHNGSPLVVFGGRAPAFRWGTGSLQELDHPALLGPVTKRAATVAGPETIATEMDDALRLAASAHRGPVFLDMAMDHLFGSVTATIARPAPSVPEPIDGETLDAAAAAIAAAHRPVMVLGSDVWADGAELAAAGLVRDLGLPAITNGMGRGVIGPDDALLVTRARSVAFGEADLVIVVGTPLDFRLGYGSFGSGTTPVVHIVDSPAGLATHVHPVAGVAGDLATALDGLRERLSVTGLQRDVAEWAARLRAGHLAAVATDEPLLTAASDPIHPARIYGELRSVLEPDAVVIGDGGDFVSFAGRFVELPTAGCWLDPGPFGCLGTAMGYALGARLARPSAQIVVLMGDGATGFSLMDVDTLVRHRMPVLMVVGNNGVWGLEKQPMQMLYGYDVAADLAPGTRYDEVVRALGGDGECVTDPAQLGQALRRGLASPVPYLVNVITDPAAAYPRKTFGI
ncbi:MAG: acetolactate synthase [Kineosporiaceae bacterium]|nr:acetolactate synthase [Kineosporiaceae bacterium]